MKKLIGFMLLVGLLSVLPASAQQTPTPALAGVTLNSVLSRRQVNCGLNQSLYGFGYLDPNTGNVGGFDVDFCRAIAAAIFGDATAINPMLYDDDAAGEAALRSGQVDVLLHNVVWTLSEDANDLEFGPVNFYNGQTIMVRRESTAQEWADLDGAPVCVVEGGSAAKNLPFYVISQGITLQLVTLPTLDDAFQALNDGQCVALSADLVNLTVLKERSDDPTAFRVWQRADQLYTREPFAPVIRAGDEQWTNIVRWTVLGLIQAEQLGVSSETVNGLVRQAQNDVAETDAEYSARVGEATARFLDPYLGIGTVLGLNSNFMVGVIREVGNYGEIYNRYFGTEAIMPMERSLNALWQDGGLLYSPDWK